MTLDAKIRRVADKYAQPALHLRRAQAPTSGVPRSFFGGWPRLPAGTEWPRVQNMDGEEIAPTFLAQIQLEDLPRSTVPGVLPPRGTLAFFVDTDFEGNGEPGCAVIFAEGVATELPELTPPDDLMLLGRTAEFSNHRWLNAGDKLAKTDFRYAIKPIEFRSYRSWADDEFEEWEDEKRYRQFIHERLVADLEAAYTRVGEAVQLEPPVVSEENWSGWPHSAACVEHVARAAAWAIRKHMRDAAMYGRAPAADLAALYERLTQQADGWAARAQSMQSALSSAESGEFRTWYENAVATIDETRRTIGADGKRSAQDGAMHSSDLTRVMELARLFAARLVLADSADEAARVAALRGLAGSESRTPADAPMHQMLGHGDPVQSAPMDHADDVLLLQVSGERGLAWHDNIGCVLQFWISPEDLEARRFESAVATLECD